MSDGSSDSLRSESFRLMWGVVISPMPSGLSWNRTCRRTSDEAGAGTATGA